MELYSIPNYFTQKASGITGIGDTMQEVVTLTTPDLPAGMYHLMYSFEVDFNGTKNTPAYFRMGGTYGAATEFAVIAAQNVDHMNRLYGFPKDHPGGAITISLDFKTDVSQFDVDWCDVVVMRVA